MSEHATALRDSASDIFERLEQARARRRKPVQRHIPRPGERSITDIYAAARELPDARLLLQHMANAGWLGIDVAEAHGGLGLGLAELVTVAEVAGGHPAQPPLLVSATQLAGCLESTAASPRSAQLLEAFLQGRLLAGVAWQETLGVLSADTLATHLAESGDGYVLNGRKIVTSPLEQADGWICLAATANSQALVWVERSAAGVTVSLDPGSDEGDLGSVEFAAVAIPGSAILYEGAQACAIVARACDKARIVQAAMMIGLADNVFGKTIEYLKTRVQFERPLGSFQALQHRCVDILRDIEVARACLADVLNELEANPERLAYNASRVNARASAMAVNVTRSAIQLHGAIGATDELTISSYFKRALQLSAWLGNAGAHRRRCQALRGTLKAGRQVGADISGLEDRPLDQLDVDQVRAVYRKFLHEHLPAHLRFLPRNAHWDEYAEWFRKLSRKGWAAPAWPKEYGGMELDADRRMAMLEEQESFGVPRNPTETTIGMIGPLLIRYGTQAQKEKYLPRILAGEHVWCQGYSEPNAGSDLASLRTRATLDGDRLLINGQKIWTSIALEATHMFALVRTHSEGPRQKGITFVLIDMTAPGLTLRPIRDMAGHGKFCEVFFDNVPVPLEDVVGEMHEGWAIAKSLLGFERVAIGSPNTALMTMFQLETLARSRGLFEDPAFQQRFTELELDTQDVGALYRHFTEYVKRGEKLPDTVPLCKLWATETHLRISEYLTEVAAEQGAHMGVFDVNGTSVGTVAPLMNAIFSTIFGGTNDIQRNILSRQALDLPAK